MKFESAFWYLYAYVYDLVLFIPQYRAMLKEVCQELELQKNDKILDIGCGTGNFVSYLRKSGCKNTITGIDVSISMLRRARSKENQGEKTKFIYSDVNKGLQFASSSFDKIIAINSIYALSDPKGALLEMVRVLKKNGTILIVNPKSETKFFRVYFEILSAGRKFEKLLIFFVTLPLFIFNALIKIKANNNSYHFFDRSEWEGMLTDINIEVFEFKDIYLQSSMIKIVRVK